MHWSRELLAPTAGVRRRIVRLVAIGLLIVAASLASFIPLSIDRYIELLSRQASSVRQSDHAG